MTTPTLLKEQAHLRVTCAGPSGAGGVPFANAGGTIALEIDRMTELSSTRSETQPPTHTWGEAPLVDLIEHILITYHHPLRADLDTAVALAERVAQVHGPRDASGRLARLSGCVTLLRSP